MKKAMIAISALTIGLVCQAAFGQTEEGITGRQILEKIDANEVTETQYMEIEMVMDRGGKRKPKTSDLKIWVKGKDNAAIEVTSGPDKGTRFLRLGDDLWIASREAEKPMKISGHMLRQGFLDSDWSYDDTTNNKPLAERFEAKIVGEEVKDGKKCWVMELKANDPDETYALQKLWVDQATYLPVYQELMALSGMLLKTMSYEDLKQIDGRWTPTRMTMKDALKNKTQTTIVVKDLKLDEEIDPKIISLEFVENVR